MSPIDGPGVTPTPFVLMRNDICAFHFTLTSILPAQDSRFDLITSEPELTVDSSL
jgi:hypothetical protein